MATFQLRSVLVVVSTVYVAHAIGCASHEPFRLENAFAKKSQPDVRDPKLAKTLQNINDPNNPNAGYAIDTKSRANEIIRKAESLRGKSPSVGSKLKSTASYVGDALHFQPHRVVTNSSDPTSLSHNPGGVNAEVFVKSAAVFEAQQNTAAAHEQYQKALAVEPNNKGALIGLGRLLHRHGQMTESVETYERALAVHPNDPVILNDMGLCLARLEDYDRAISSMQMAVQSKPDSVLYRNNLAAVFVEAGHPREAVSVLAEIHGGAIANYNVGYLLNQRGLTSDAYGYFAQALAIDPSMSQARTMLAKTAPGNRSQPPSIVEPRRVPSTETKFQPQHQQARRPSDNELGTLAPIVSPSPVGEKRPASNSGVQPSPFNYQLAAKSFTKMPDPHQAQNATSLSPESTAPSQLGTAPPSEQVVSDPMQHVLSGVRRLGNTAMNDTHVGTASYQLPVEEPRQSATDRANVLRMPNVSSTPMAGGLVPPTPQSL